MKPKKIVLIGGPGTGKSAVIDELMSQSFDCKVEISRQVTIEAKKRGIDQLFLEDPIWFSKQLLEARTKQFVESNSSKSNIVFFDRGLPDVVAYLDYIQVSYDDEFINRCKSYSYDKVFILPTWAEIFTQDNERYETFNEAIKIQDYLKKWYIFFGYNLIEVPKATVNDRIDFILKNV